LSAALLRDAPARELATIRTDYGIAADVHAAALRELRGESSVLRDRARDELARIEQRRTQLRALVALTASLPVAELLVYVLLREQDHAVDRILQTLALVGDAEQVRRSAEGVFAADKAVRRTALATLRAV